MNSSSSASNGPLRDIIRYTTCSEHCFNACILKVHIRDGKIWAAEPDDTINRGTAREDGHLPDDLIDKCMITVRCPALPTIFTLDGANNLHGNFGKSLWSNLPVMNDVRAAWPVTLELGTMGIILAQVIALPVGIYSAMRQDTIGDYLARSFAVLCIAVPGFWVGTMVIVFPAIFGGIPHHPIQAYYIGL